jgi:hypothetical protein
MQYGYNQSLFALGRISVSPKALYAIDNAEESLTDILIRHQAGDWGEMSRHERACNDYAARRGIDVISAYRLSTGNKLWVITSGDRRTTKVQIPLEDYNPTVA